MEEVIPDITQNLPALFTIDGRQYELKRKTKRAVITPASPIPLAEYIPGVVFGEPNGSIVPVTENDFNIFLTPYNNIIPLKYFGAFIDPLGAETYYISNAFYTVLEGAVVDFVKTTQAQSKVQYLMNAFNALGLADPPTPSHIMSYDYKILKEDFISFVNPNRLIWTASDIQSISEFLPSTITNWNSQPAFVPGTYYYSQVFLYLELS